MLGRRFKRDKSKSSPVYLVGSATCGVVLPARQSGARPGHRNSQPQGDKKAHGAYAYMEKGLDVFV
jgi:hypothetical protein